MDRSITPRPHRAVFAAAAIVLFTACASESPLETADGVTAAVASASHRGPDLGSCDSLAAPQGTHRAARLYAEGVQIYQWDGAKWMFVGPSARLYRNHATAHQVGTHYTGPTWEDWNHSKVVGTVMRRCTPNPNAIPWLLLSGVSSGPRGIFDGISHIQRLNTTGGNAPASAGSFVGELANVPYTAEYQFYRSR